MHHREPLAKDEYSAEPAALEDRRPAFRFEKGQAPKHDDVGTKLDRVGDEFVR